MSKSYYSLGLMSGTSGDGVDASVIHSDGETKYKAIKNKYFEYDKQIYENIHNLKEKIHNLVDLKKFSKELIDLERQITLFHVEVIKEVDKQQKSDVIGFHGQTIYDNLPEKISRQLGNGKLLSQLTNKNIVKTEIDLFPIGQQEGVGHVIKQLNLNNNEKLDVDFVLSKSNINKISNLKSPKLIDINEKTRLDLTNKNSYMLKSWNAENSPILPIFHIDKNSDDSCKLWVHTNSIAERLDLSSKKSLEIFFDSFESFPLLKTWQPYLSEDIFYSSKFNVGEIKEASGLCIAINTEND